MAKERSDKHNYESKWGGGYVTAAQYLAEMMCERVAAFKRSPLFFRFWSSPTWKREFLLQVRFANAVLKLFPPEVVFKTLCEGEGKKAFSLNAPWLDALFVKTAEAVRLAEENRRAAPPVPLPTAETNEKPREAFSRTKSPMSRLRDLDG